MITPTQFKSDQEFFDAAWKWLITDNNPKCSKPNEMSELHDICLYRKVDGDVTTGCVIGSFMPDELMYNNGVLREGEIKSMLVLVPVVKTWWTGIDHILMGEVQQIHDESFATTASAPEPVPDIVHYRTHAMNIVAIRHKLKTPNETQAQKT